MKNHQLLLFFSIFLIVLGGLFTFTTSTQGRLHLRTGIQTTAFTDKNNNTRTLPFDIMLSDFQIQYYAGTPSPSDYISTLIINDNNHEITGQVSMNKIFSYKGFRFYQSGYDGDEQGSILLVKSDKYGLLLVYFGYFLLLTAMIIYFFSKNTQFRKWLNHPALKWRGFLLLFFLFLTETGAAQTKNVVPKHIAEKMGGLPMLYSNRICPMETFARDFTTKLYGKSVYQSLTSEQVLSGLIFYPENWKNEPIIKIKDKKVQQLIGINGKYASFSDFFHNGKQYKLAEPLAKIRMGKHVESAKNIIAADEKIQLLVMLQTGAFLKIFPVEHSQNVVWYSPADELPDGLSENETLLIRGYFDLLKDYAVEKDWNTMEIILNQLIVFQTKSGGERFLSPQKIKTERLYNTVNNTKPIAFVNVCIGIFALIYFFRREKKTPNYGRSNIHIISSLLNILIVSGGLFLLFLMCLRGYIIGRIPLGNGFQTMQFLAVCILFSTFFFRKKSFLLLPFGFLFSGLVLLVSVMGAGNPQITHLQPVLLSPLLSVHVSLIMMAYALFGFITFNSLASFFYVFWGKIKKSKKFNVSILQLHAISRIFLYPSVFFLTAGIIVGSIWAEVSWGRYWSWDPKETWALITLILYALPLHSTLLKPLKKPLFFHGYMITAFLSVLMTYFGVNYLLGGLHSYTG